MIYLASGWSKRSFSWFFLGMAPPSADFYDQYVKQRVMQIMISFESLVYIEPL